MSNKSGWGSITGALGASLLASLCCIGPLIIVSLGAGGVWASYAFIFEPYRPYLIALVAVLFGYAYYKLYINPPPCGIEAGCISPRMFFIQRVIFWIILAISIALITFPYYA